MRRHRRQAEMAELSRKFNDGELNEYQKREATNIITSTQSLLANTSFQVWIIIKDYFPEIFMFHCCQVFGLERGELSQQEVLSVLSKRTSGNMTQNTQIQQLAVDTQVIKVFAL